MGKHCNCGMRSDLHVRALPDKVPRSLAFFCFRIFCFRGVEGQEGAGAFCAAHDAYGRFSASFSPG